MSPRVLKAPQEIGAAKPRWRRRKPSTVEGVVWVVWPARAHLLRGLVVLIFILAVSVAVYFAMDSQVYAGIAFFTLIVAVSPFYLPTSYQVDDAGIAVDSVLGRRHKPWRTLKAFFPDGGRGVLVSPVERFNLPARTRGFYLPFQDNREQVMALVEKHLKPGKAGGGRDGVR
jgi:hypothetical protein